jgi:hypothetical protein
MSDLFNQPNISKFEKSDPSYIKVHEPNISRSLDRERNIALYYKGNSINSKKLLFAAIMGILKDRSFESDPQNLSLLSSGEKEFYSLLLSLEEKFLTLSQKDKSTDITFINELSELWNFLNISIKRRQSQKHPPAYIDILTETFKEIASFGQEEGESFGYYLEAHKKSDWFPVPYLQMLANLHQESFENKTDSHLKTWQDKIHLILDGIVIAH